MRKVVTASQMREIDRLTTERYALPTLLLMETAANASARAISSLLPEKGAGRRALIVCGRGNNGGDGAALARILWTTGAEVEVLLIGRVAETRGDARVNFEIVRGLAGSAREGSHPPLVFSECAGADEWVAVRARLEEFDLLIDALFGTGLTRPLEGLFKEVVADFSAARGRREGADRHPLFVSLDIPTGLDADSAEPAGEAVRADLTVTYTAPKPANVLPPASHLNGRLVIADIGSPPALIDETPSQLFVLEAADARAWLRRTRYAPDSYKNTHGHALVVAGSREMCGAAVLCAGAAMRAGAGLVTVASPASAVPAVAARVMPEVMTAELPETAEGSAGAAAFGRVAQLAGRANVIVVGPGLTTNEETRLLVREIVERRAAPVVIDADGLNALAPWPEGLSGTAELPLVLTPHPGEMRRLARLSDDAEGVKDRVAAAREFAAAHGVILVLKGSRVLVAAPDGRVFVNPTGNAGLGTAGAGDTLTGIIAGFLAQAYGALGAEADPLQAVLAAVYVGGAAGDLAAAERGMRTMVASDVREQVEAAMREQLGAAVRALDPEGERPR
ncbi:MAG: NAD(P)H-hydrate dehydratase [Acidobacteria bacterium]|nr:NAD(P)H-hydrate dehydratase [Acidobacteriota bacterium]